FSGVADSTRENVLYGLQWLTSNTHPGDFRFFYFCGYGECIFQEKDNGQPKEARRVQIGQNLNVPGDYRHQESGLGSVTDMAPILPEEFPYHIRAFVTSFQEWRLGARKDAASKILYTEFNQYLAKFPPEVLSTVGEKTSGLQPTPLSWANGARGQIAAPVACPEYNEPVPLQLCRCHLLPVFRSAQGGMVHVSGTVSTQPSSYAPNPTVIDDIPLEERELESIRAKTFIWTGWQRRKKSEDSAIFFSGPLSQVFTEAVQNQFNKSIDGRVSYESLFEHISAELEARSLATTALQFIQLWTPSQGADEKETSQNTTLGAPVVL
ncbi:hypothetical protein FRC07_008004, partial [Ceratobasidium sp. 392]